MKKIIKCEVKHNGDLGMGHLCLNGWVIYALNGWDSYSKISYCVLEEMLFFYSILGLNEYTTFRVSVAANNSFGIGPYSQPVKVKTQESSKSIVMFVFL